MDIALGVSMAPVTVRMVLVEGENADGVTVDHDVFEVPSVEGSANVADQVVSAILGTRESAKAGGHRLTSIGVSWSNHTEASALRDALAADGIDDVMLVSEGRAAAALAQAVGRAVGYDTTALLFLDRDTATLSVVQTDSGSVAHVLSRTLHSADAVAVLTEVADAVAAQHPPPQGLFVVGAGVEVGPVKARLEQLVPFPVNAPEDGELALARGAALASATVPVFEASTVGLAYSKDPDRSNVGPECAGLARADTQMAPATVETADDAVDEYAQTQARTVEEERKPFLLVGSALTAVFVVGVVTLAISLAVNIRPTVDQRPSPAEGVIVPSKQVPTPVREARQPTAPLPPEIIEPPIPVVRQAPVQTPRTVFVEAPAPAAPPPAPAAPPPAVAPPVVAPPAAVPPPVIVPPQPQWQWPDWTQWTPPNDSWLFPSNQSQNEQFPQTPQLPQEPQQPQETGSDSGAGSGDSSESAGSGSSAGSSGSSSDGSGSGDSGSGGSSSSGSGGSGSGPGGSGASSSSGSSPGPEYPTGSTGSSATGTEGSGSVSGSTGTPGLSSDSGGSGAGSGSSSSSGGAPSSSGPSPESGSGGSSSSRGSTGSTDSGGGCPPVICSAE